MISTLLFDFNNVLLFVEESDIKNVTSEYQKISVPNSWSKFFYLNTELLQFIKEQKLEVKTAVLSASEFSLYQPEIKELVVPYFNQLFFAKDKGWSKDLPATYLAVAGEMKLQPNNFLFVDDKLENVEAAGRAGMSAIHYTNNATCFNQIKKLI